MSLITLNEMLHLLKEKDNHIKRILHTPLGFFVETGENTILPNHELKI